MKKKLLTVPSMENNSIEETQEALVNLQDVAKAQKETDIVVDSIVTLTEAGEIVQESLKGIETQDGMVFEDVSTQSYKVGIALESARGMLKKDFKDLYESINVPKVSIESITKTPNHALSISLEGALDFLKAVGRKIKEFIKMLIDKIKKFFGFIIKFFKGTEKDIKEQAKNLEKDKFDIKDPGVMNKNTKYYSKKDVLDAVDSKDPRLNGLGEIIGSGIKGAGFESGFKVDDTLSLDDLVRKVKEIILRPEGDADSLKAEIIAYINANLTDKKIEEKRNTVVDLSEITEDFLAIRSALVNVKVENIGGNLRITNKSDVISGDFDEEEFRTKFKYCFGHVDIINGTYEVYFKLLLEKSYDWRSSNAIYKNSFTKGFHVAFDRFPGKDGKDLRRVFVAPIDDPSSESFFDSWLVYNGNQEANGKFIIDSVEVVKVSDVNNRAAFSNFGHGDDIDKLIDDGFRSVRMMCGVADRIIKDSKEIEKFTKMTLESFETLHFDDVSGLGNSWHVGDVKAIKKHPDDKYYKDSFENIKNLCKIFYELSKYWLRFPIGTKRVIDYVRSVTTDSLYIKVKG